MRTKAQIAAAVSAWLSRQPIGPGAPFRLLSQDDPALKRDFDALSRSDQDDVLRTADLLRQAGAATPPHTV